MGQYYIFVNLDKKQYLETHPFDSGCKLWEFLPWKWGVKSGLCILLIPKDGFKHEYYSKEILKHKSADLIGSWCGDRIAILGDYSKQYQEIQESTGMVEFTNIAEEVAELVEIFKQY